eukprot:scaffold99745_cov66-Phaeocystis_antarctica.AAC.4
MVPREVEDALVGGIARPPTASAVKVDVPRLPARTAVLARADEQRIDRKAWCVLAVGVPKLAQVRRGLRAQEVSCGARELPRRRHLVLHLSAPADRQVVLVAGGGRLHARAKVVHALVACAPIGFEDQASPPRFGQQLPRVLMSIHDSPHGRLLRVVAAFAVMLKVHRIDLLRLEAHVLELLPPLRRVSCVCSDHVCNRALVHGHGRPVKRRGVVHRKEIRRLRPREAHHTHARCYW